MERKKRSKLSFNFTVRVKTKETNLSKSQRETY